MRLRLEEREPVRAFWRSHFEVWAVSGLTQRDYCDRHGLNLKSFGNWRAQLKREDAVGPQARWGRYPPRLRSSDKPVASHMANPMVKKTRVMASPLAAAAERRRSFSDDAKRRIVAEASRPGSSLSAVARRYHIDLIELVGGRRVRFDRDVDPETMKRMVAALEAGTP